MLELAFATRDLRSMCEDAAFAEARHGPMVAKALVDRLADLRAADHPLEMPFVTIRPAAGADAEHLVVDLAGGRFLAITVNHEAPPCTANGAVDWELVTRLIVLRLE